MLFLDEPTTGLDPQSRNDMWEVIEGLVEGGTTVLLTTQYLEEADRLASQLVVVDHGRVIAEGTPANLKANLGATVLEVGLHDHDDAPAANAVLAGVGSHTPNVNGTVVEVTVDNGPRRPWKHCARSTSRDRPHCIHLPEPSLDDVFLALTGRRAETDDENGGAGPEHQYTWHQDPRHRPGRPTPTPDRRRSARDHRPTQPEAGHDHQFHRRPHPHPGARATGAGGRIRWALADTWTVTKRNLIAYTRIPEALFFSTVQPIMFVLLFRYVFGGAIHPPRGPYVNYLMPGIFVQTVAFGAVSTSVGWPRTSKRA